METIHHDNRIIEELCEFLEELDYETEYQHPENSDVEDGMIKINDDGLFLQVGYDYLIICRDNGDPAMGVEMSQPIYTTTGYSYDDIITKIREF